MIQMTDYSSTMSKDFLSILDFEPAELESCLALAARVGPRGHVLGADISEQSVARARERSLASPERASQRYSKRTQERGPARWVISAGR